MVRTRFSPALAIAAVTGFAIVSGTPQFLSPAQAITEPLGTDGVLPVPRLLGTDALPVPGRADAESELSRAADPVRRLSHRAASEAALEAWIGSDGAGPVVRWNEWTGLPHRILPPPQSVFGSDALARGRAPIANVASAEAAARGFLSAHLELWAGSERPDLSSLVLVKSKQVGEVWFLVFQQRHRGIEVEGGRVDLRLRTDGTLLLFGSDWFPGIAQVPEARLALGVADARARVLAGYDASEDLALGGERVILPLPSANGSIEYRLSYRLRHRVADPPALWRTYVDANTGEILARENDLRYDTLVGQVKGRVHLATPTDPFTDLPFRDEVVTTTLDSTFTDFDGRYARPNTVTGTVMRFGLRGPFLEVIHAATNEASQQASSPANDTLNVLWTPANSDTAERDAWYHSLLAHTYLKNIEPAFTGLDYRVPCTVNINATCNAFWDGVGINFYRWGIRPSDGRACANTGEIADVVYHEYGHGRTQYVFAPLFPSGAMHEGLSDYLAATITNQPLIGRGFFGPGTNLRSTDNTVQVDQASCAGESHCMGQAIAGALWEMREALISALGNPALAVELADSLFHYAGYGGSTWHDDYLLDLLLLDDNDGTLLNGTPHYPQICPSFLAHNIPCPPTTSGAWIVHTPLPDRNINEGPVLFEAQMGSFAGTFRPETAILHYRLPYDFLPPPPFSTQLMTQVGGGVYRTSVPVGLATGTVEYYLTGAETLGSTASSPPGAPAKVHSFDIGYLTTAWEDNFETDSGWTSTVTMGASGRWMRVNPNGTPDDFEPSFFYQTEDDHTPNPGAFCFVTGDTTAGLSAGAADVDNGCVTLLSPAIDLSAYANASLEYWRWFTDETRYDDTLTVAVSATGTDPWIELERQAFTENLWLGRSFDLEEYIPLTNQVRIRVRTCDRSGGSLLEAAIDDVKITSRVNGLVSAGDDPAADDGGVPKVAFLGRPAPNPAGPGASARVDFGVPDAGGRGGAGGSGTAEVRLSVLDARGRVVRTLLEDRMSPGRYSVLWDGAGNGSERVAPGVYFLRLYVDGVVRTVKAVRLD